MTDRDTGGMDASEALIGARIRRVDSPWDDLLALTLAGEHVRGVLLVGLGARARGVGLAATRPHGNPAGAYVQGLRRRLEGAMISALEERGNVITLKAQRGGETWALELRMWGRDGNAVLRAPDGRVSLTLHADDEAPDPQRPAAGRLNVDLGTLESRGQQLLADQQKRQLETRRAALSRSVRSEVKRLERRLLAIQGDLARADDVDLLREHAGLLLSHLHALDPAATHATVTDYGQEPAAQVELTFAPGLGPKQQAEAWFRKARRLERGAKIARQRLSATHEELAKAQARLDRILQANDEAALSALTPEPSTAGGSKGRKPSKGTRRDQERRPYREFVGAGDRLILVGRGPADNDALTLKHARSHDLWLHARGYAGAHVVLPLTRGESCPPELLCDAATLAVHFSKGKGQEAVDVTYTPRRYVRKARKAAPGLVTLQQEKVFRLETEPRRLARLLASERRREPQ